MPPMRPEQGGIPNRLDTPWAVGETDVGNYRYQNTWLLAWERWRSRQLEETNWLAAATLDRVIERTIGTMITVEPRTEDDAFNTEVRAWLDSYWNSRSCDIRNLHSFSSICHLLFRGKMRDGDVGLVLTEDQYHNPKVQLIEAQRIKTPTGEQYTNAIKAGNQIVDGVEMDANGAHVAYWVATRAQGKARNICSGRPARLRLPVPDHALCQRARRAGFPRRLHAVRSDRRLPRHGPGGVARRRQPGDDRQSKEPGHGDGARTSRAGRFRIHLSRRR